MDRRRDDVREVRVEQLAAVLGQAERAAEQGLRGGGAEQHERLRLHDLQLLVEPGAARLDLEALGRLVDAPSAAFLELEVLDDVREIRVPAFYARRHERTVELPAGGAHERPAGAVLSVARLLADQHEARALQSLAEDGLRGVSPQVAAAALRGGLTQGRERPALGEERRRIVRFLRHSLPATRLACPACQDHF
jgi:hypothetical protein